MRILTNGVKWDDVAGVGYFQVITDGVYDSDYFEKYVEYEKGSMSGPLMKFRSDFVERHAGKSAQVVDVGIGCGAFVSHRNSSGAQTFGYDVNDRGVRWLLDRGLWWDPMFRRIQVACFWDSLEHMESPELMLGRVRDWAFVSIPIFENAEHVLRSKHFRPREHFWYFTREGLVRMFRREGFEMVEWSSEESQIGREDIQTFAFRREFSK